MQPLSKALRRRLKRLAPGLREADIDRFEHERRAAMDAALRDEDPLYAAALAPAATAPGPEPHALGLAARAVAPRAATGSLREVRQLGSLLQRAAEVEQRRLERKADWALARQGEAARPKRPLARRAGEKKTAAHRSPAKKMAKRKAAPKKIATRRKLARKKSGRRSPRRGG